VAVGRGPPALERARQQRHVGVGGGGGGGAAADDPDVTLLARTLESRRSSSYGHSAIRSASSRIKQVSQELRRLASLNRRGGGGAAGRGGLDRSKSAAAHALKGLKFISRADGAKGWDAVEERFDKLDRDGKLQNGLLPRSMFGQVIGMREPEFAGELFDALARRRNISGESISKAELLEFWDQISDTSFDGRLQTFFDMYVELIELIARSLVASAAVTPPLN